MKSFQNCFPSVYCVVCVIAIMLFGAAAYASAQTASTNPVFEAATIKSAAPFDPAHIVGIHIHQARASYIGMPLKALLAYAYNVLPSQVSGPGWMDKDLFDIEARFPKGNGKEDERRMLQVLLKNRFKLAFHIEKKQLEVYALVVGKHGAQLKPSSPDLTKLETNKTTNKDGSTTFTGKYGTMTMKLDMDENAIHYKMSKMTMEELAGMLSNCTGGERRKVDDQTGIKGNYQVALDCPLPGGPTAGGDAFDAMPADPKGGGALARSLDALGLKLEKRKLSLDIYIIDHVEKPSEN